MIGPCSLVGLFPLRPCFFTDVKVCAANGTTIPVLGTVTVNFEVAGPSLLPFLGVRCCSRAHAGYRLAGG